MRFSLDSRDYVMAPVLKFSRRNRDGSSYGFKIFVGSKTSETGQYVFLQGA